MKTGYAGKHIAVLAAMLGFGLTVPALGGAQGVLPFSLEVRAGAAAPTGDAADYLDTGFGLELNGAYNITPQLGAYAGYTWARASYSDFDANGTDSGLALGLLASPPGMPMLTPWIQAGVILHKFKVSEGSFSATSEYGTGYEIGAGVAFPVAPGLKMTPGVRYRSYESELDFGEFGTVSDNISYLSVDIGARLTL